VRGRAHRRSQGAATLGSGRPAARRQTETRPREKDEGAPLNTPSHLLITAAAARAGGLPRGARRAAWLGAVAPDLPLLALSLAGFAWYEGHLGWEREAVLQKLYGELFFRDALWIAAHNALQAPLVLVAGLAGCALLGSRAPVAARRLTWFLAACLLHAALDIVTHHDDGPLLLFPFDWELRFASPISYWDHRHYASRFLLFEVALDVVLLGYLSAPWLRRRLRGVRAPRDAGGEAP